MYKESGIHSQSSLSDGIWNSMEVLPWTTGVVGNGAVVARNCMPGPQTQQVPAVSGRSKNNAECFLHY